MAPGHMHMRFQVEIHPAEVSETGDPTHKRWVGVGNWYANLVPNVSGVAESPDQVVPTTTYTARGKFKRTITYPCRLHYKGQYYMATAPPRHYGKGNTEMTELVVEQVNNG